MSSHDLQCHLKDGFMICGRWSGILSGVQQPELSSSASCQPGDSVLLRSGGVIHLDDVGLFVLLTSFTR